jgi:NitT/TauT family transport system substrate-binding protein
LYHPSRKQFVLIGGAAFATRPAAARAQAQGLEKIRLAGVRTDDLTPIFYAIREGLYQRAGLDVEVVPVNNGAAATAAVVSGVYDLGKSSPMAAVLAHGRGLPLTAVGNGAMWFPSSPFVLVVVPVDSPIKTAADLNGKTGATSGLTDTASMGTMLWIDKSGGDAKSVKWVEVPNSAIGATVASHRVDFGSMIEPQLSAAVAAGEVRVLGDAMTAIAEHWIVSLYLSNPAWAAKHADAIKRWVRVTYDAAAYTNTHPAETAPMMSEITKIPLPVFRKMARIEGATSADPALLQPVIELAARYNVIPRSFPAKEMYFNP